MAGKPVTRYTLSFATTCFVRL